MSLKLEQIFWENSGRMEKLKNTDTKAEPLRILNN
jgi:hypothetical protein